MATTKTADIYTRAREAYLSRIDARLARLNGMSDHPVHLLRRHARQSLSNSNFPDRKNEDWKYTPVRKILAADFSEADLAPAPSHVAESMPDACDLIFVNGVFHASSSDPLPEGVFFGSLEEALEDGLADVARSCIDRLTTEPLPVFDAVSIGLSPKVYFLSIPISAHIRTPIRFVHICEAEEYPVQVCPVLITHLGRHGAAEIIEEYQSGTGSEGSHINASHKIFVGEGARISIYRLQNTARNIDLIAHTTIYQKADSTAGVYSAELGCRLMRNNMYVIHEGTNVTSNLYGLFIAGSGQHTDTQSFIDHALPHCMSNELYKGILTGNGHGVFNGKIIVRQDAQKTNAFQQNSTLVLSPKAVMDSKPQLEIFADDVKCSHGATIGQLDEEALFYLQSRGLKRIQAQALLQKAFVQDVIDHFPNPGIAAVFSQRIDEVMAEINDV